MRKNNVEDLNQKDQYGQKYFRIWMKSENFMKNKKIVAKDRKDAERQQRERQKILEMSVAPMVRVGKNSVFVGDLLTKHFLSLNPSRKNNFRSVFNYWKEILGEIKLIDFSPLILSDLQDEINLNISEGLMKPATANKYISFLKQVFKKAYLNWFCVPKDFSVFIKNVKVNNQRNRILSAEEKERLFKAAENLDKGYFVDFLHILFQTGMRKMEALGLMGRDCDTENREILLESTKNGRSRKVHMTKKVQEILERRKKKNGEGYIFDKLRVAPSVSMFMKKVCLQAEIDDFVLHDIRHDFATRARKGGMSMEALQRTLGHASYKSLSRYLHFEDLGEHKKMDEIFEEEKGKG